MSQALVLEGPVLRPIPSSVKRAALLAIALFTLVPLFHFCGDDGGDPPPPSTDAGAEPQDAGSNQPHDAGIDAGTGSNVTVRFFYPRDGQQTSRTVQLLMTAENFVRAPADGNPTPNRGHFHVSIDVPCSEPGTKMTPDLFRLDFSSGTPEAVIALTAGEHTLCLQAALGDHTALDATHTITIEVVE